MSNWDDDLKQRVIQMYQEREPTPESSTEIVKEIAEEIDASPNGVRMILTKAGVYVKKGDSKKPASGGTGSKASGGSTRVSKEAAHGQLTEAIESVGGTVDSEIISKLTGKAALYLAGVINAAKSE